jgi:integrase
MGLAKQAKILSDKQQEAVLSYLAGHRQPVRNVLMFLLSVDAGLRSKEIAGLKWSMVTDAGGDLADALRLTDSAAKGNSGGVVYLSKRLKKALQEQAKLSKGSDKVIMSQRGHAMSAQSVTNWFFTLYQSLGFDGCSSHSGRRTAITRWARKISSVGGSIRDVQALARHSSLAMTQKYVEVSEDACKRVVG